MDSRENGSSEVQVAESVLDGVPSTSVENSEDSEGRQFGTRLQLVSNAVVDPNDNNCDEDPRAEVAEMPSTSTATTPTSKKRKRTYKRKPVDDDLSEQRFRELLEVIKRASELQRDISRKVNELHSRPIAEQRLQSQNVVQSSVASTSNDGDINSTPQQDSKDVKIRYTPSGLKIPPEQPILLEGTVLKKHQMLGFKWLHAIDVNVVNGILGDEMGLGKTLQVIAMICFLIEKGFVGPFVILAPLSIVPVWIEQFKLFAPKVPTLRYTGNLAERKRLAVKIEEVHEIMEGFYTTPIVVCPYHMPIQDPFLEKMIWRYMVVDEGHRLNNPGTKIHKALLSWQTHSRCILTGTPLQNDVQELWSLLNFLMPLLFEKLASFDSWFSSREFASGDKDVERRLLEKEKKTAVATRLREVLSPFLLRRLKSEVDLNIPEKTEYILTCVMTEEQAHLYNVSLNPRDYHQPEETLVDANGKRKKRHCVNSTLSYREPSSDDLEDKTPVDVNGKTRRNSQRFVDKNPSYQEISSDDFGDETLPASEKENTHLIGDSPSKDLLNDFTRNADTPKNLSRLAECQQMMTLRHIANHPQLLLKNKGNTSFNEELVQRSSKMVLLDAMLKILKKKNHKVLIFSYFTMVLDLIGDMLDAREYKFCRIDGSCSLDSRKEQINDFTCQEDFFAFLMTTRTGGLGLNLVAADTVIFFDNDWNPQVDLQAEARCHRIGQTKPVAVYRLAVKDTIDIAMLMRAEGKQKLSELMLGENDLYSNKLETKSCIYTIEMFRRLLEQESQPLVEPKNGISYTEDELEELLDRSKTSES